MKLAINSMVSHTFANDGHPLWIEKTTRMNIIKTAREKYGTRLEIIEDKINRWYSKYYYQENFLELLDVNKL